MKVSPTNLAVTVQKNVGCPPTELFITFSWMACAGTSGRASKGPLTHLFANVVSYLKIDLLFRLRKLPPRTLLIIFSDHGFVENPAFTPTDKYETPRYVHGKDSPFEVIVPWAWIMRL